MVEFLKTLYGEAVTEESLLCFKEELGKKFVPKETFNQKNEEVKTLRETLASREEALAASEQLRTEKEALEAEIKTMRAQFDEELASIKRASEAENLNRRIDEKLTEAGARNLVAVRALLDMEKIVDSQGMLSGLDEQIAAIKAEQGYLFEPGVGNVQFLRPDKSGQNQLTHEDFRNLGYMERLKLKKENPSLYQSIIQK